MSGAWIGAFVGLTAFVVLLGLLVLGMLRRLIPLMARSDRVIAAAVERMRAAGLPAGAMVPHFVAATSRGDPFDDRELRGSWSIVFFLESGCTSCDAFVRDIATANAPRLAHRLIVVTSTPADAELLSRETDGAPVVLLQRDRAVSRAFESDRTPHFFVVDSMGIVRASGWPNTWDGVDELVAAAKEGGGASDRPTLERSPSYNEHDVAKPVEKKPAERGLDLQEARMQ